jgi:hypothetical protein
MDVQNGKGEKGRVLRIFGIPDAILLGDCGPNRCELLRRLNNVKDEAEILDADCNLGGLRF